LQRSDSNADKRDDGRGEKKREDEDGKKKGAGVAGQGQMNMTTLESGSFDRASSAEVAQGPPWANCFVEYVASGKPALEEWVMRGEKKNLDAFRAWRKSGSSSPADDQMTVRCVPASSPMAEQAQCLQCLSHSGASPFSSTSTSASSDQVATVQAQVVSTFTDLKECLAETVGGMGFCLSGQVVVPV